jgi:two-component system CheB/CheR fusion protein
MAFVLVQHLAPDHKSILTELVRHYTRMPVFAVEDGMTVHVNCVYIIPPKCDIALMNGALHLLAPTAPHGHRLPIDFFFCSLAHDRHEQAIGIVLSGTGSDGTLGVRAIKDEGGMVMAQSTASADFDGMPHSAIATGLVDYQLPPAQMAAQLMAYMTHAVMPCPPAAEVYSVPSTENALNKVFVLLRMQTGHDFSQYKPSTIRRRIERRMAVHQIETTDNYVKYLQQAPAEIDALFRDLLIGVTHFFRDPSAFQALEESIIPQLFSGKPAGSVIRVWSPGCSCGEEAYSIAILLHEHMEALKQSYTLQVFATDIDSRAIAVARAGIYPKCIAANLTPERLARFFTIESDGHSYRIHKAIRDILVFSEHDVIKDPPFSKLDLISCRNLLIYLGIELQKSLFSLFHYALNPGGMLFLGSSESVGEFSDLFSALDHPSKLYRRKEGGHDRRNSALGRTLPPMTAIDASLQTAAFRTISAQKLPLRELTEQALLQQLAPSGALINEKGDILYLHGRTGMYLEPAPGEASVSILKMAREGLQQDLTVALHKAVERNERVRCPGLQVKTNGHFTTVNLTVAPVSGGPVLTSEFLPESSLQSSLFLVMLAEAPILTVEQKLLLAPLPSSLLTEGSDSVAESEANARIAALKQELLAKEQFLQATNEELETSNEELKSASEEMQSVNEELQSVNEELETSKEELQSVNEELMSVNSELQNKVLDLSRANNDMNNLLAGTGIATIFVDFQLRILRFTPTATQIINLIQSDVGRPVAHIVSNLVGYDRLLEDAQAVLDTLIPKEIDVQTQVGKWYTMRILPYRTLDNVIEGAVITFVDINEVVQTREALQKANKLLRLAVVVRDAHDAITVQDLNGRILAWNPGATRMYGWSEAEALSMNVRDRIPAALREAALVKVHQLSLAEILEPYRTQRITQDGTVIEVWMTATSLLNEAGQMYAIATTERSKESTMEAHDAQLA